MSLSSFVDLTSPENLHWLAVLGSSVVLSVASSIVPNYAETSLDMRSHNRVRLFNETTARLHISYIIFLLALIASDDIDKTGNTIVWLNTLIVMLVFILFWSIIMSGRTINRIQKSKDREGIIHKCNVVDGVCRSPIGWWMGCKVCFINGLLAFLVGILCLGLAVNPTLIKHGRARAASSLDQNKQKDYYNALREIYKQAAHETRDEFEETVLTVKDAKYKDPKLNASYWYSHNGTIYQLGTTHQESAEHTYKVDETSIIGCGFVYQNSSVRWDDISNQAVVWPYNGIPGPKDNCKYAELQIAKIKSIVCATYNGSDSNNPGHTVGACVFTTGSKNFGSNSNYHEFLKAKAERFYNAMVHLLKNNTLVPQ